MELDNKDKKLLEILQKNSRESLTILAKEINLSIDSTHKRLKKLQESGIIVKYSVFIDPKKLGYDLVANIQIKLQNINEEELNKFIAYLRANKNAIELITTLGDYDLTCVLIAKNTEELDKSLEI